jgi:hypothetical protein
MFIDNVEIGQFFFVNLLASNNSFVMRNKALTFPAFIWNIASVYFSRGDQLSS